MGPVAVYDACVLFPAPQRDLLIRLGVEGLVSARWTDRILDECFTAVLAQRPGLQPERLARTRGLMNRAIRGVRVTDYEGLADAVSLPDLGDRHVLAAAIRCGAEFIVTNNRRDFPSAALTPLGLAAFSPDDFVLRCFRRAPSRVWQTVADQAAALRCPPRAIHDLLETLAVNGSVGAADALRAFGAAQH